MAKRKKKSRHEEHIDESWLLPYADLLTLMCALFIVLFAMSSVDAQKFNSLSRAFNEVFVGGTGIMEFPSASPNGEMLETDPDKFTGLEEDGKKSQSQIEREELEEIQTKINQYISDNKLATKLTTALTDEGLLLTIRDNVFFDSGVAEVRQKDKFIAEEISDLLVMNPPRNIIISGHTDNVPISTARFESNWELSVMRAISFMKLILNNNELTPEMFSAKGFGEHKPIASNNTLDGRSKNRRVEILIMPRTSIEVTSNPSN